MNPLIQICSLLSVFLLGHFIGRTIGRKIGRDEGWNERELDRINEQHRRNYARRGKDGKFNGGAV